ncbi:MAG: class I SAM-dependent methyltransferase [Rhodospirillaceae bacterium]
MTLLPWRVKNFVSEHAPLLYHFAANFGRTGNSGRHWDERLAATWDDRARHWPTKNELVASITRPSDILVDLGCGNGSILRYLKSRGYERLHGVEVSEYAIERLRHEGIEMHRGKFPAIPLPDAAFDVAIASQVLEHVIRRGRFATEIRRILRPGGRALVFVPDDCLGPISESEHVAKYNARSLRQFLERRFQVLRVVSMRDSHHEMPILFAEVQRD